MHTFEFPFYSLLGELKLCLINVGLINYVRRFISPVHATEVRFYAGPGSAGHLYSMLPREGCTVKLLNVTVPT